MRDDGPRLDTTIKLRDGRTLAYAEWGDPAGTPVVMFHGSPSSRMERHLPDARYRALGVRYVTVDRPGMGRSDPLPQRTLLDWPEDVRQLADALGWAAFVVLGGSGGGPYAAACAYAIWDRLAGVGIVSGVGRVEGSRKPRSIGRTLASVGTVEDRQQRFDNLGSIPDEVRRDFPGWMQNAPPSDQRIFSDRRIRAYLAAGFLEAFRQGVEGAVDDEVILDRPWGFRPEEISVPVKLWHGRADTFVPVEEGEDIAAAIPGCTATFYPNEGHFLMYEREEEILTAMISK